MESTRRVIMFIIFLILLLLVFLAIWMPFVNNLNKDIWRTKWMLKLIPLDIIEKIKSVQKYFNKQSLFATKFGK